MNRNQLPDHYSHSYQRASIPVSNLLQSNGVGAESKLLIIREFWNSFWSGKTMGEMARKFNGLLLYLMPLQNSIPQRITQCCCNRYCYSIPNLNVSETKQKMIIVHAQSVRPVCPQHTIISTLITTSVSFKKWFYSMFQEITENSTVHFNCYISYC
jgi:hypothetical protein